MRILVALLIALHGLIHLMGFAKAFALADLPQLTQPISRPVGIAWLVAAALLLAASATLLLWPRRFVLVAGAALVVSQLLIAGAWADARYGSLGNLFLLAVILLGIHNRPA